MFPIYIGIIITLLVICIISTLYNLKLKNENIKLINKYNKANDKALFLNRELNRKNEQFEFLKKSNDILENKNKQTMEKKNKTKDNFKYKGKRALVGDYIDISSYNTMKVLEKIGIDVDIVRSGEDIVDKIKNGYECDVIFTNNLYNKGYDGTTTLNKLKEITDFNIPVIIHTVSKNQRHHFVNQVGFDEYIEKPLTEEKVIPILNKIWSKNESSSNLKQL